ncbi:RcnB family protein [Caulobacter sp. NIBR2454]|uniref:RcnB family protein n=1 Tax=Caulobacter sp. NIBR2454 TaxID=3015996 RepID=UPI0022B65042|nr:RcnB family protein [Caulobacter sp. NIBR2454]
MKRLLLTLAAAAAVIGPIAATASEAAAQDWGRRDRYERRDDRRDYRHDRREYRDDRRNYSRGYRDGYRSSGRWDRARHNGYYWNNRWYYGPPPSAYYGRPGFSVGYSSWRPGGYLPPYYREHRIYDYGRYGLRPPPRGYYWYRAGDDYLLAAVASGLIFDIITR